MDKLTELLSISVLLLLAVNSGKAQEDVLTFGGTDPDGTACVFPFIYKTTAYNECTDLNNGGLKWCSITADYDKDEKWGNCAPAEECSMTKMDGKKAPDAGRTKDAAATLADCEKACKDAATCKGAVFITASNECHLYTADQTPSDDSCCTFYQKECKIQTYGGNDLLFKPCVFPFTYLANKYTECTTKGSTLNKNWCSTTTDFDQDKKWGYCIPTSTPDEAGTGTTAATTAAANAVTQGACDDAYTETKNTGAHFGLDNAAKTLDACKKACSDEAACVFIDFKAAESKCWLHKDISDTTFTSTDTNQYIKVPGPCVTTEKPKSTTTTPPKIKPAEVTTGAATAGATTGATTAGGCKDSYEELKETGTFSGIPETSAKTRDQCEAACSAKQYHECASFEFKVDPKATEGECFLQPNMSPNTHKALGSWSNLYIRTPCGTTVAGTAGTATVNMVTGSTTTIRATTPSKGCQSTYKQVYFDKTAAGGTESKEGQGDIVSCRNACNKLSYTDCKAFVLTKAGKCRLFKGPSLPQMTDQNDDIVVERDEQCETATPGPPKTTLPKKKKVPTATLR